MSVFVIKSPRIMIDGINMSCKTDTMTLALECEIQEKTSYCSSGAKTYMSGLTSWTFDFSGFYSAGDNGGDDVDNNTLSKIGTDSNSYLLALPTNNPTTGNLAYFGKSNHASYSPLGEVGDVAPFEISMQGDDRISRGTVVFDQTVVGTSGYGVVYDMSSLESGQSAQTILQLANFSGAGNVRIVLDASCTSGFGSGVTEVSFSTLTARGADLQTSTLSGSTNKHFYRIDYASSGPTGIGVTVAVAQNHGV